MVVFAFERATALTLCLAAVLLVATSEKAQGRDGHTARSVDAFNYARAVTARQPGTNDDKARRTPRIVGGNMVSSDEFKTEFGFAASLQFDGQHFCGATFLDPQFGFTPGNPPVFQGWNTKPSRGAPLMAITAAHCLFDEDGRLASTEFLSLVSETADLNDTVATEQRIKELIPHPAYDEFGNNDIAIILLEPPEKPVLGPAATVVLPSLLSAEVYQRTNMPVLIAGWGRTAEGGALSDHLRTVRVPYADQEACHINHDRVGVVVNHGTFCAGFAGGGFDSCQGDSGGGVIFRPRTAAGTVQGARILVGVVSWGIGCARYGLQGIYTDVLRHVAWIESTSFDHINHFEPE